PSEGGCGVLPRVATGARRHPPPAHPIASGAIRVLPRAFVFRPPAGRRPPPPVHVTSRGVGAILYLIVFGGIVAYSSYLYAMKHLPVSLVSIFTYINPVVALIAGSMLYGEGLKARYLISMAIIFAGVLIVNRYSRRGSAAKMEPETVAAGNPR